MTKLLKDLKQKTQVELEKEVGALRTEISKMKLDWKVNQPKDTNSIVKKKRELSVMLYLIHEKAQTAKVEAK